MLAILLTVRSFVFPEVSSPKADESEKFNIYPFEPYVPVYAMGSQIFVTGFVAPNDAGVDIAGIMAVANRDWSKMI